MLKALLKKVVSGATLSESEAYSMTQSLAAVSQGAPLEEDDNIAAAAALLTALALRGESVEEFTGCARYLREHVRAVHCGVPCADLVGTGGDCVQTFNISTTSALVAAGAGVVVAKHGNRSVSSRCGAADLLEKAGVTLDRTPEQLEASLAQSGIAFLFARTLHPAMGAVAPLRRDMGIRTIFNLVGPLANPAHAEAMVVGVCNDQLLSPFAEVLRNLGVTSAITAHSEDGMDEISSLAPTHIACLRDGVVTEEVLRPEELLSDATLRSGSLKGGDPDENLAILRGILSGADHTAKRGAVLLNAAALCFVAGKCASISAGISLAAHSIDSGAALRKLEGLCRQ